MSMPAHSSWAQRCCHLKTYRAGGFGAGALVGRWSAILVNVFRTSNRHRCGARFLRLSAAVAALEAMGFDDSCCICRMYWAPGCGRAPGCRLVGHQGCRRVGHQGRRRVGNRGRRADSSAVDIYRYACMRASSAICIYSSCSLDRRTDNQSSHFFGFSNNSLMCGAFVPDVPARAR